MGIYAYNNLINLITQLSLRIDTNELLRESAANCSQGCRVTSEKQWNCSLSSPSLSSALRGCGAIAKCYLTISSFFIAYASYAGSHF